MLHLRPGLWAIESSTSCNSYLIEDGERLFLVDPGAKFRLNNLALAVRDTGHSPYDVTDILLTHYDWDHTRSAAEWQRRTGARAWLGADDAEVLRTRTVPGPRMRRFFVTIFQLPHLPDRVTELRGEVAITPSLRAVPSPGHTPGHYAYVWRDVAFIGDAADTGPDGELVAFDASMMTDLHQGDATREMLSALPVNMFCPGHTPPRERHVAST